MFRTMSVEDIARDLLDDEYANWSRAGAYALAEWLDQTDEVCMTQTEYNRVAIRCEFSEYASARDAAEDYGYEGGRESVIEWLEDRTTVIPFDGGVIIWEF